MNPSRPVLTLCGSVILLALCLLIPPGVQADPPTPTPDADMQRLKELKTQLWQRTLPPGVRFGGPGSGTANSKRPSAAADWSRLVFSSYRDNNWEIYIAHGDGSQPLRLTNHAATDTRPRLNRGATRVAFASTRDGNSEIYTVNADGTSLVRLTNSGASDSYPAWSPDSSRIAFSSTRDGQWELYVMNSNGTGVVRLTNNGATDTMPAWSPDGSQIAWVRSTGASGTLWVMNADGTNAHALTGSLAYIENPAWSPSGAQIAFDFDGDADLWNELAVINANGSGLHTVYDPAQNLVDPWMGSWSTDEQTLVFSRVEYIVYQGQLYLEHVYVDQVPAAGGSSTRLLGSGVDWLPDVQTMDWLPPQSWLDALPPYSRFTGFPLSWSGMDAGVSGVASYDIQYRVGAIGAWTYWATYVVPGTQVRFSGSPGATVYFRSRARDNAGNVSAWPIAADGETHTSVYTWQMRGQVSDNRNVPLTGLAMSVLPTPVSNTPADWRGRYDIRLSASGDTMFNANRAGYAPLASTQLNVAADGAFDFYLPPVVNLVQDGGFESDLSTHWQGSGTITPSVSSMWKHTGLQAVGMLLPAPDPTLSLLESPYGGMRARYPAIVSDDLDTVHAIWIGSDNGIYYSARMESGVWSTPELVFPTIGSVWAFTVRPSLALDADHVLHASWGATNTLYYSERPISGTWSAPIALGPGDVSVIMADTAGRVHIVYQCDTCPGDYSVSYRERLANGTWQPAVPIGPGNGYMVPPGFAMTTDGTLHVIWPGGSRFVTYRSRTPDGVWTPPEIVYAGGAYAHTDYNPMILKADSTGALHAMWQDFSGYYARRSPGGQWSSPESAPYQGQYDMQIDVNDVLHVGMRLTGDTKYTEIRRAPGTTWTSPIVIGNAPSGAEATFAMTLHRGDLASVLFEDESLISRYREFERIVPAQSSAISQVITLSASVHQPTLALMYQLSGMPSRGTSRMELLLSSGLTTTQIYSLSENTGWAFIWADVSDWAGHSLTLTFSLQQGAGNPSARLLIDDVSLGPWLTPIAKAIEPAHIDSGVTTSITITGSNFISVPTVMLNGTMLAGVEWIDEQTLRAVVPQTMSPGIYDVVVANPGGPVGVMSAALRIGRQHFLPFVMR